MQNSEFNDPVQIDEGVIDKVEVVSKESIVNALSGAGAFEDSIFGIINSGGGGKYDFFTQQIAGEGEQYKHKLYLPQGQRVVHNAQNFGNFLWGAAGYLLGIPTGILLLGAHINSRFDPFHANGYPPQWDSVDDQISIIFGTQYAKKHQFRRRRK